MKKIAIIGAGLSGLVVAKTLGRHNEIHIFEKSRGVGGRMSTRYADPFQFDHGAQFFMARSQQFKEFLIPYIDKKIVSLWDRKHAIISEAAGDIHRESGYVAAPKMTALAHDLSATLNVKTHTEITKIIQKKSGWCLESTGVVFNDVYDWVVMAVPAPQCVKLMPSLFTGHKTLSHVKMTGCYSLMMGFNEPLTLGWNSCTVHNSPIAWMAVNSEKPLRNTKYSLIAQSTNDWAEEHINDDLRSAESILFHEVKSRLPQISVNPIHLDTHRWRYAATTQSANQDYLIDENSHLAACGDWCLEGNIESAFTSGYELGHKILDILKPAHSEIQK